MQRIGFIANIANSVLKGQVKLHFQCAFHHLTIFLPNALHWAKLSMAFSHENSKKGNLSTPFFIAFKNVIFFEWEW